MTPQSRLNWSPPPSPPLAPATGTWCGIAPIAPAHAPALQAAWDSDGFTYLPYGPFDDACAVAAWGAGFLPTGVQMFSVLTNGRPVGVLSYLRINPPVGTIEIGHIHFGRDLVRTPAATEAVYLLAARAFDQGYRRLEWKCDAANAASCRAAVRLGFRPEGIHRQAAVVKDRNRDTAWFSILDSEWPAVRDATQRWLMPENFDASGRQKAALSQMTAALIAS